MSMPKPRQTKLVETRELLFAHAEEIAQDGRHWTNFLDTASRLYRYKFSELVLIHAQKPQALNVAKFETWTGPMKRYVKRGAKGIALVKDVWGESHLDYVYDIADTGKWENISRTPASWSVTEENEKEVLDYIVETYGLDRREATTLPDALRLISESMSDAAVYTTVREEEIAHGVQEGRNADTAPGDANAIFSEMQDHAAKAGRPDLVESLDEESTLQNAYVFIAFGLYYMFLRRCGYDPSEYITEREFSLYLKGFEHFALLDALGAAMMQKATPALRGIYEEVTRIDAEKLKKHIDNINSEVYNLATVDMKKRAVSSRFNEPPTSPAARSQTAGRQQFKEQGGQRYGKEGQQQTKGTRIHTEGRLPVSESVPERDSGGTGGDREVRDKVHEPSAEPQGEQIRVLRGDGMPAAGMRREERGSDGDGTVSRSGTEGEVQGSGPGSGDGRVQLHEMAANDREDGGRDRPGGLDLHVIEETEKENNETAAPEEPDEIPPGLILPDLPSMDEQIRELQALAEAPFAASAGVPTEVVDEFLRHGNFQDNSDLRIIYNFMSSQTDEEYTGFLEQEYRGYSRGSYQKYYGLTIDGIPYTMQWSEEGIVIAAGKSMDSPERVRLTWEEASRRTEQLLLAGQYAPQVVLDSAKDHAVSEHAKVLKNYYSDLTEGGKECFRRTDTELFPRRGNDNVERLREELAKPEVVRDVVADLKAVVEYEKEGNEPVPKHWQFSSNPEKMLNLFLKFQKPALPFQADPAFRQKEAVPFIAQDVVDEALRKGQYRDSALAIFSYFLKHPDKKERETFLREYSGTGGGSLLGFYDEWHDSDGIQIRHGLLNEKARLTVPWPRAVSRIGTLIENGTYLTADQYRRLPAYELDVMANRVASFYLNLKEIPAEFKPPKRGNYAWEAFSTTEAVKTMEYDHMLTNAERGEALYRDMTQAFAAMESGARNYQTAQETIRDIRLYLDGKYTMFPGLELVQPTDALEESTAESLPIEEQVEAAGQDTAPEAETPEETAEEVSSAERKNGSAPGEGGESGSAVSRESSKPPAAEPSVNPDTGAADRNSIWDAFTAQSRKQSKQAKRASRRKRKAEQTEATKKYHGFPDEVSDGQGQQMSLFDFLSSDGSGFNALKFVEEAPPESGNAPEPPSVGSGSTEKPTPFPETEEAAEEAPETPEETAEEMPSREPTEETPPGEEETSEPEPEEEVPEDGLPEEPEPVEIDFEEAIPEEELHPAIPETDRAEEEEDLAFVAELIPGESAFVFDGRHYLIREIRFGDGIVSAQDMDYAMSSGGQIFQTFTFHEIHAVFLAMQNMEPQAAEPEEEAEEELPGETEEALTEVVARYQSASAMQDGSVEDIAILRYLNYGKFYNHYGFDETRGMGATTAGPFDTLEDARQTVLVHRPGAVEIPMQEIGHPEINEGETESAFVPEPEGTEEETAAEEELPADIPGQTSFVQEPINYRITEDTLGEGGPKEKFRRNLAAIQTLKQIEAENRLATAEEQEVLAQYVGWGGLPQAFLSSMDVRAGKTSSDGAWAEEQQQLLDTLTPEEYSAARESTLTSFYTPPIVIKAMYRALSQMGFHSGNVLEPSCGVGNFMGLLPETMDVSMYGTELDSISGRIAKQLYQKNQILVQGFETAKYPDNFFDVVIGNVPFGDFSVNDPRYKRQHFLIHDYFIAKSLDLVRPGGVVAVITSSGTMDKKDPTVRKYISDRADLLGAIRLPNNTFTKNAGTSVVSDILFFQKRDRAALEEPDWVQNRTGEFNPYFQFHRNMVLGRIEEISTRFGMEESVLPYETESLEHSLSRAVAQIHGIIPELDVDETAEIEGADFSIPANPDVRNYSYTVVDHSIYYREDSRMKLMPMSKTTQERVEGMVDLTLKVRQLLHAQMEDVSDADIAAMQAQLNTSYDAFVASYGRIYTTANRRAFEKDSSYSLLSSLEILNDEGNFERKADIFSKRTISRAIPVTHVDTASEALAVCIGELAKVDLGRMSELTGKTEEELESELAGVVFRDIECSEEAWEVQRSTATLNDFPVVMSDEYLSGNVRHKLRMAQAFYVGTKSRSSDEEKHRMLANIEALKSVQPIDLKASEIDVRIGATWVPIEYYNDFLYETFHIQSWMWDSIKVEFVQATGTWSVRGKGQLSRDNTDAYQRYGTRRANGLRLYEDALNLKSTKIYDKKEDADGKEKRVLNAKATVLAQQKQELLCERFKDWIYKSMDRRTRLEQIYNEKFNNIRPREYDGSHITFVGMSPEIHLMDHQKNAVAHILYGKNTLLAHCVGAGKTYEMAAAGMECRRLGLAKKCMYVVPNHLTEQWASEFLTLYPAANILAATKKDFEPANRKRFCSRIATGDYDAIIIGHSQFEKIPLSAERQSKVLQKQIDEIEAGIKELSDQGMGKDWSVKQMEKSRKSLQARLEKLNNQERKDRVVTFEELGVDRLFVDESHNYKNLFLYTKMTNVAGISQTDAQKSSDMFAKCQYLDEITGGRGVVFATGTPISNSMVELYTIMRYLQYHTLEEMNMTHFDAWASTFGETVNAVELAPEGTGYRTKTRFAKFYNLPELTSVFREAADVKTADMLNLPVPEAEYINETLKPSEIQQKMVESFGKRAEIVRNGGVDSREDNMLKITNDGRKCALDERLMNDLLPDEEESKVNRCVKNAFDVWEKTAEERLTQLIFCDLSTPKEDGSFNVYDDIRNKLVAKGVPKEEVAFIHEYKTEVKKDELFKKVRSGQVRILLGSTQKMGAGTNVQDRLIALHHLDCPWKPSDLEQQEGRILRQGNRNKKVTIYRYVTEGTFDSYMWQLLENKQKFISQIMTSKSPVRSAQDVDDAALTYAEIKALATGNPYIKEKMTLDIDVSKLKIAKSNYTSDKYDLETKVAVTYPQTIQALKERIEGLKKDAVEGKKILEQVKSEEDDAFQMKIGSNVYTKKKEAGEALIERCKRLKGVAGKMHIGSYHSFELYGEYSFGTVVELRLTIRGSTSTMVDLSTDPSGNITRIHNALGRFDDEITKSETKLAETESLLEAAQENLAKPFEKEEELQQKLARLNELNALLSMDKSSSQDAIGVGEEVSSDPQEDSSGQTLDEDEFDARFGSGTVDEEPGYGVSSRYGERRRITIRLREY